jgi:hypothetical protein
MLRPARQCGHCERRTGPAFGQHDDRLRGEAIQPLSSFARTTPDCFIEAGNDARCRARYHLAMPLRLRKFLGAIALFALVIAWALVAMALAQVPAIREHAVLSVLYYIIAGIGWVLPAMPIVAWMSRRQKSEIGNRNSGF